MMHFMIYLVLFFKYSECKKQPNIILILADDLGWNDVDWHDLNLRTPNLRKLAFSRHTVQLENAYVNQLCSPTRSALMTGFFPHHVGTQQGIFWITEPTGVPLRFPFFPEKLRQLGYSTHMVGKWHLGYCKYDFLPSRRGFDSFHGFYGAKEGYFNHSRDLWDIKIDMKGLDFFKEVPNTFPRPDWSKNDVYSSRVFADDTVRLIEGRSRQKPFFIYLAFQSVHAPMEVPTKYLRRCAHINWQKRRIHCAMLSAMDEAIGQVYDALAKQGILRDTVVIFSSDNGGETRFAGNNWPLRGNKATLWEGGTKTNSFVFAPGFIKQFATRKDFFHIVDWYTTILAIGGQNILDYGDSINQWPMILGQRRLRKRHGFIYNINKKGSAFRSSDFVLHCVAQSFRIGKFKYIEGDPGRPDGWIDPNGKVHRAPRRKQSQWVFDISADPFERRDLSRKKPRLLHKLREKMAKLAKSAVPSIHKAPGDPRANPIHFNHTFASGWC